MEELRPVNHPPIASHVEEGHLNSTLCAWCVACIPAPEQHKDAVGFRQWRDFREGIKVWTAEVAALQTAVEDAVRDMRRHPDGGHTGQIVSGETTVLRYGVGQRRKEMAYIWKISGDPLQEEKFVGLRFKLCEGLVETTEECQATPLLVDVSEGAPGSVLAMQQLVTNLKEAEGASCLDLPMEHFIFDGETRVAIPYEKGPKGFATFAATSMKWKETIHLMREVAEGLNALHVHGFVHHQFTPDHLICSSDKTFGQITNFGLLRKETTPPKGIVGTLPYLPPDYLLSEGKKDFSTKLDVYSFGVTLYALTFGREVEDIDWAATDIRFAAVMEACRLKAEFGALDSLRPLPPFPAFFGSKMVKHGNEGCFQFDEAWNSKAKGGFQKGHFPTKGPSGIKPLRKLIQDCMHINPEKRPLMSKVLARLTKIESKIK